MNPMPRFTLRLFLWLPVCFGAWYFSSIILVLPIALTLDGVMTLLFPDLISRVGAVGNHLMVETLIVTRQFSDSAQVGEILFQVNPLKYAYSLPLYTALVIAAPEMGSKKAGLWLIGILLLILIMVFGVSTEIMKILVFGLAEDFNEQVMMSAVAKNILVLAYQFGYLILTPIAPLALWFSQFGHWLAPLQAEKES